MISIVWIERSRINSDMEDVDLPSKKWKVSATFPIQAALQIRLKYQWLQQRHSPLSATARRLLLGCTEVGTVLVEQVRASQLNSLLRRVSRAFASYQVLVPRQPGYEATPCICAHTYTLAILRNNFIIHARTACIRYLVLCLVTIRI